MKKSYSFTLIELLVVIAIIGILATMLFPMLGSTREKALRTKCSNNFKEIYKGFVTYNNTYNGWLPMTPGRRPKLDDDTKIENYGAGADGKSIKNYERLELLRANFLPSPDLYICPSSSAQKSKNKNDELGWTKGENGGPNLSYAIVKNPARFASSQRYGMPDSGLMADRVVDDTKTGETASEDGLPVSNHDKFGQVLRFDSSVTAYEGAQWFTRSNAGHSDNSKAKDIKGNPWEFSPQDWQSETASE